MFELEADEDVDIQKTVTQAVNRMRTLAGNIATLESTISDKEYDETLLQSVIASIRDPTLRGILISTKDDFVYASNVAVTRMELLTLYNKMQSYTDALKSLVGPSSLCSICFERPVDAFVKECGHSFCMQCIRANRTSKCPMCRADYGGFEGVKSLIFS